MNQEGALYKNRGKAPTTSVCARTQYIKGGLPEARIIALLPTYLLLRSIQTVGGGSPQIKLFKPEYTQKVNQLRAMVPKESHRKPNSQITLIKSPLTGKIQNSDL